MLNKGIFDAEKNGILLGLNVIAQKKNEGIVKKGREDFGPRRRKVTVFWLTLGTPAAGSLA